MGKHTTGGGRRMASARSVAGNATPSTRSFWSDENMSGFQYGMNNSPTKGGLKRSLNALNKRYPISMVYANSNDTLVINFADRSPANGYLRIYASQIKADESRIVGAGSWQFWWD